MLPLRPLAAVAVAGFLTAAVPVSQSSVRVRIASPTQDAYLAGSVRLVAVIEPASAVRDVTQVTFFADGTLVCTVALPPFDCDWQAGEQITPHQIRATATLRGGRRVVDTVRTRALKYVEAVDVDVIQITAVVTDRHGRFVRGLKRSDFAVTEDGKPQNITHFAAENIPLELVAALDVSSSMREALPSVRTAAKAFLSGLEPQDQVTLLSFNDNIFTLMRRSTDQSARARAIDRLAPWGGTALYDAIVQALDLLGRQSGRRAIVVFSDGDDQSSRAPAATALARTEGSDATIYVIGQGRSVHSRALQKFLQQLADISGGRAFFSDDPVKLRGTFAEILEDIRNQSLIAYPAPDSRRDGAWHEIKVNLTGGNKHQVRARQGYRLTRR